MKNNDKISQALHRVYKIVDSKGKIHILQTNEITRSDREILTRNGWLQEIIKGWYLLVRPDVRTGESSAWYVNFWDFTRLYLEHHYGDQYCLSAEHSLDLHIGKTVVSKQVIIMAKSGNGIPVKLPFDTSLLIYSTKEIPENRIKVHNLFVMPLPFALCKATPSYFLNHEEDAEIALLSIRDPSELIHTIIKYNFHRAAERIIGAYSFFGHQKIANDIKEAAMNSGIRICESNPFKNDQPYSIDIKRKSPHALKIELMWVRFRETIISIIDHPPGLPDDMKVYLKNIEEIHTQDAYHSLSIEGYQVSIELIQKIESGHWDPSQYAEDAQSRNALAARGYYEAFLEVKKSIIKVIQGDISGKVVKEDLPLWFRKLFSPSVKAKILKEADLWGYRHHQVYIRNSRHTPPSKEYLLDSIEAFYNCLIKEEHPAVRAILGHFIFVYIHPYMDGNGRMARFLMNVMLASGGYPWVMIKVENRKKYFQVLENASVDNDIEPFTKFVASEISRGK